MSTFKLFGSYVGPNKTNKDQEESSDKTVIKVEEDNTSNNIASALSTVDWDIGITSLLNGVRDSSPPNPTTSSTTADPYGWEYSINYQTGTITEESYISPAVSPLRSGNASPYNSPGISPIRDEEMSTHSPGISPIGEAEGEDQSHEVARLKAELEAVRREKIEAVETVKVG